MLTAEADLSDPAIIHATRKVCFHPGSRQYARTAKLYLKPFRCGTPDIQRILEHVAEFTRGGLNLRQQWK